MRERPEVASQNPSRLTGGVLVVFGLAIVVLGGAALMGGESPAPRPHAAVARARKAEAGVDAPVPARAVPASTAAAALTSPAPARPVDPAALGKTAREALRDRALARIAAAEAEGRFEEALELTVECASDVPAADLAPTRERLQKHLADETTVNDALAQAETLAAAGDHARALAVLAAASDAAKRLGRTAPLEASRDAIRKASVSAELTATFDEVARLVSGDETAAATIVLDRLKKSAPGDERIGIAERRIARRSAAPAGWVYVETDMARALGFYARRSPVTKGEYRTWLESIPAGQRRPLAPWASTGFPESERNEPVKWVNLADAELFAQARGERLPTAAERQAMRRLSLGVTEREGELTGKVLNAGFRTVKD